MFESLLAKQELNHGIKTLIRLSKNLSLREGGQDGLRPETIANILTVCYRSQLQSTYHSS